MLATHFIFECLCHTILIRRRNFDYKTEILSLMIHRGTRRQSILSPYSSQNLFTFYSIYLLLYTAYFVQWAVNGEQKTDKVNVNMYVKVKSNDVRIRCGCWIKNNTILMIQHRTHEFELKSLKCQNETKWNEQELCIDVFLKDEWDFIRFISVLLRYAIAFNSKERIIHTPTTLITRALMYNTYEEALWCFYTCACSEIHFKNLKKLFVLRSNHRIITDTIKIHAFRSEFGTISLPKVNKRKWPKTTW